MEVNRREFLAGMTALTAAALCGSNATFAPDSCDTCKLDGYLRKKDPSQLSVSFLGTFALFVFKDRIEAYTPKIVDGQGNRLHNYWFAKPTGGQGLNSDHLFDLQSPHQFGAISTKPGASGRVPTFTPRSPGQPNNVDNLSIRRVYEPTPANYLP